MHILEKSILCFFAASSVFLTIYLRFPQMRLLTHAIKYLQTKGFNNPKDESGILTQYQAICAGLPANAGLGCFTGVTLALKYGGPGSIFWMIVVTIFGISINFLSITAGMLYRDIDDRGITHSGIGLVVKKAMPKWFLPFGIMFSVSSLYCAFQNGNMEKVQEIVRLLPLSPVTTSVGIFLIVSAMLIGGLRRVALFIRIIIPATVFIFIGIAVTLISKNPGAAFFAAKSIFNDAFSANAISAGFIGGGAAVLIGETGLGSSTSPHSGSIARPVGQGIVGMVGPIVNSIILSAIFAIILIQIPETLWPLTAVMALFGLSGILAWSSTGEDAAYFLFGPKAIIPFRVVFCLLAAAAPFIPLPSIPGFLGIPLSFMLFCNTLTCLLISGKLKKHLRQYDADMKAQRF